MVHLHSQRQGKLRWDDDLAGFVPSSVVRDQQVVGSGPRKLRTRGLPRRRRIRGCRGRHRRGVQLQGGARRDQGAEGVRPHPPVVAGAGPERKRGGVAPPLRRLPARPVRGRRASFHWGRHALGGTRQAVHLHQHRQRPGQDLRRQRHRRDRRGPQAGRRSIPRHRRHRNHDVPGAVHAGRLRGARPDASAASCSIPPASPPSTPGMLPRARSSRTSASGSARGTTRKRARTWTPPCSAKCRAVRESVGFMDASTLGKIEIRGKDAGEFLNRIYTNAFKKLPVG